VKAAACQFEPAWLDVEKNLATMRRLAVEASNRGAELIVFPECCVTGYSAGDDVARMAALAEPLSGPGTGAAAASVACLASDVKAVVAVGLPELSDSVVYNSMAVFGTNGDLIGIHHKVHLWDDESAFFRAGSSFAPLASTCGTLGPLVCYDLEFPEPSRVLALRGAEILIVSTANMEPWGRAQDCFVVARSLENGVFLVLANVVGQRRPLTFVGGSCVVAPDGEVLASAGHDEETVVVADIDLGRVTSVRHMNDYLARRQPVAYVLE
jgi:5-aminopentanamidase